MDTYRDFIIGLRKIECATPFLIIINEHPPKHLEDYVKLIIDVTFVNEACNAYYGEIKKIIFSFFNFYKACINNMNEKIEEYTHELKYPEIVDIFNSTLSINDDRHEHFKKIYVPSKFSEEVQFNTIVCYYDHFREKLVDFGDKLTDLKGKQSKIEEFVKEHLPICIERVAAMCDYTHVFISKMLFARVKLIRVSLQDILHRIRLNTVDFQEGFEIKQNALYNEMYDLNKERLSITRRLKTSSTDTAEIDKKIDRVRHKIENFGNFETMNRLKTETEYWMKKLQEFDYITSIIVKIKDPLDKMIREEKIFSKYRTIEMHGSKATCWATIGENFKIMKEDLEQKYTRACRSLITFFACRGTDRIYYNDEVGSYYVDEYGHQNYITQYGLKFYHVNCDGEFVENVENDKYYFDKNGRYIIENGEKIFQLAPCTNKYKRTPDGLLYKYLLCHCKQRCSQNDLSCGTEIKDLTDLVLLPKTENIDIRETLDAETVKYLWDSFGWILPDVLYQVILANSKNPIHYFGHALLTKKYAITEKKTLEMKKYAQKYRDDIYQKRKDDITAKTSAWKAKQAKRCKPEDLDNTAQEAAQLALQAEQQWISDIHQHFYD